MMTGANQETVTLRCELLDWDSEHFGFPIGRVVGDTLTLDSAEAIDDWCTDQGVRCLYFLGDAEDADSARVAANHGYRIVDVRLTSRRSLEGLDRLPFPEPEGMEVREAVEQDLDYLRKLAGRSHQESRFYFDGGFPRERCGALYEAWVERGFYDPDRTLRVPTVDGERAGYHVLGPPGIDRVSCGELMAVDERQRGSGVGPAFIVSTLRLVAARGDVAHLWIQSARNLAAIRLHERFGFQTEKVEVWQHKWYA
jgi:GNAT superfamily N-acetyltransferase